jgi:hypothetical protein
MTHKRTALSIAFCLITSLASAQEADKAQPAKDAPEWSAAPPADGYGQAIEEAVQSLLVQRLMDLAADTQAAPQVRADVSAGLQRIKALTGAVATAHGAGTREDITRFLARPADPFKKTDPLPTPAGEPIGGKGGR